MTPLLLFLLACAAVYIGTVQAAFSLLMRLPLRLNAERRGQRGILGDYLDEPVRLFAPASLLQAVAVLLAAVLSLRLAGDDGVGRWLVLAGLVPVVPVCTWVVPLLVVRRHPERVLGALLPSFHALARLLHPLTGAMLERLAGGGDEQAAGGAAAPAGRDGEPQSAADERQERELLHSVVEFGDTRVREVMTPRPDVVAVRADATLSELRALFVERQYSRLPVYEEDLDHVLGFVFVKDLVPLSDAPGDERIISRLLRPAHVVPETRRVATLLKEFQRQRVQIAVVHDEYGGTAGLVTLEDLIEEIVGEIRDEYDVEAEPIVDEGGGSFVFAGTVPVDDMAERLDVAVERQGFETVAGYLLSRLGRVPRVGETLDVDQVTVEILDGEARRVQRVRMRRQESAAGAGS